MLTDIQLQIRYAHQILMLMLESTVEGSTSPLHTCTCKLHHVKTQVSQLPPNPGIRTLGTCTAIWETTPQTTVLRASQSTP